MIPISTKDLNSVLVDHPNVASIWWCSDENLDSTYKRLNISVRDGGFFEEDCPEQAIYNARPNLIRNLDKDTLRMLGGKLPPDYEVELKRRTDTLMSFYGKIFDNCEAIAICTDEATDKVYLFKFKDREEYFQICKSSVENKYSDSVSIFDEEWQDPFEDDDNGGVDYESFDVLMDSEYENFYISLFLPELDCILIGSDDQAILMYYRNKTYKDLLSGWAKDSGLFTFEE